MIFTIKFAPSIQINKKNTSVKIKMPVKTEKLIALFINSRLRNHPKHIILQRL